MTSSPETPAPVSAFERIHRIVFLIFLLSFATTFTLIVAHSDSRTVGPPLVLLLLSAVATTLLWLMHHLPVQNVLSIAALIALLSSLVEIIDFKTHFPFGHRLWLDAFGPQLFHLLPWPVPFIWVVAILNSRGVARFLLRPWQSFRNFGLLSLALTALLTAIFNFGLEHFAAANHLWLWPGSKRAPASNFIGQIVITALILASITPWLINKKPGPTPPPDYYPLVIWFLLLGVLIVH